MFLGCVLPSALLWCLQNSWGKCSNPVPGLHWALCKTWSDSLHFRSPAFAASENLCYCRNRAVQSSVLQVNTFSLCNLSTFGKRMMGDDLCVNTRVWMCLGTNRLVLARGAWQPQQLILPCPGSHLRSHMCQYRARSLKFGIDQEACMSKHYYPGQSIYPNFFEHHSYERQNLSWTCH